MRSSNLKILDNSFWQNLLSNQDIVGKIPFDFNNKKEIEYFNSKFKISQELVNKMELLSNTSPHGLFVILLTGVSFLVSRLSNESNFVLFVPNFINQNTENIKQKVIPIIFNFQKYKNFKELLLFINSLIQDINHHYHDHEPFLYLLQKNNLIYKQSNDNIINTSISFNKVHDNDWENEFKCQLYFQFQKNHEKLFLNIQYNKNAYHNETINQFYQYLIYYYQQVLDNNIISLKDINLISESDRSRLLFDFNQTQIDYPCDESVIDLFGSQVLKTPDKIAVQSDSDSLTYRQLDELSTRLSHQLVDNGCGPHRIICMALGRSYKMIIGILGILKSGAAVLPLDKSYPSERIELMLKQCEVEFILCEPDFAVSDFSCRCIFYDEEVLSDYSTEKLSYSISSTDPAYIIFTSGSTGTPRGVVLPHKGIINHAYTKIDLVHMDSDDIICHNLSINFVASIWLVLAPLFTGAKLVVYDNDLMIHPYRLFEKIEQDMVSILEIVPSVLNSYLYLLDLGDAAVDLACIKYLILTGETVGIDLISHLRQYYSTIKVINAYGQSECCDDTLHYVLPVDLDQSCIPIGRPSHNTQVYILNNELSLQPIGVRGELYISGDCLSLGYINDAEHTAWKFISNPYCSGQLMYRSGDYARWLSDGTVEFLGRVDHQVKIRGHRIELLEIETHLKLHASIQDCAVIVHEDESKNRFLCGYVKLSCSCDLSGSHIKDYLSTYLPEYMIPSSIVILDELPLTGTGKIDRESLESLEISHSQCSSCITEGRNALEQCLVAIYQEVLKLKEVVIDKSFFDLGGHSLSAIILSSRIQKELHFNVSIDEIFRYASVEKLAKHLESKEKQSYVSIPLADFSDYYPASSAQKRIYIIDSIESNNLSYNLPYVVKLKGVVDGSRLESCIRQLIRRHESLRTSFDIIESEVVQFIHDEIPFSFEESDLSGIDLDGWVSSCIRPFDLKKCPLFRVFLGHLSRDESVLVYDVHHIISDGSSSTLFINDLICLYNGEDLCALSIQYKDYSVWQRGQLGSDRLQKQESYWVSQLSGTLPVLELPLDYLRPGKQSFSGDEVSFELDSGVVSELKKMCHATNSTLFMVLLSIFKVLLSRYSGQDDLLVGTPVAGRNHIDLEGIIGVFINTLVIRSRPLSTLSFSDYLAEVKSACIEAYENQDYPFEDLLNHLSVDRDVSRNPLFDVMFIFHNTAETDLSLNGIDAEPYPVNASVSKFDIILNGREADNKLLFKIEYCTDLFSRSRIERLVLHFKNIVNSVVSDYDISLCDINLLSPAEEQKLLFDFNQYEVSYDENETFVDLFLSQVELRGDGAAVIYGDGVMSYAALDLRSNQVCHFLLSQGVRKGSIIGLFIDRCIDMFVGLLGILKAGCCFLPLDPDFPRERLLNILTDSGSSLLLSHGDLASRLGVNIDVYDICCESILGCSTDRVVVDLCSNDLAYILYTSGSTGTPKGVLIEHHSLSNFILGMSHCIDFSAGKSILSLTTISFDIFILESLLPLTRGMHIYLADEVCQKDPQALNRLLSSNPIQMLQMTPSRMQLLLDEGVDSSFFNYITDIMLGGEALPSRLLQSLKSVYKGRIYNMYGPTETTIWSSVKDLSNTDHITLGTPISNTSMYILDNFNHLLPIGVPGRLYIGGSGLARGYHNRLEITQERFIPNPYDNEYLIYNTGDIGCILENGEIKFLGREDNQVKLRGFRIELGEIESLLLQYTGIKEAVVVKYGNAEHAYLCGYYIAVSEIVLSDLRDYLSGLMPYYMVPQYYVCLDRFPLTPNNKVSRKDLPLPDGKSQCLSGDYVAPETAIEKSVGAIWQDILNLEKVGTTDNFFSLGGSSILLIKMHKEIDSLYPNCISVTDIFGYPTVSKISQFLSEKLMSCGILELIGVCLAADYFISSSSSSFVSEIVDFELSIDSVDLLEDKFIQSGFDLDVILLSIYCYLLNKLSINHHFTMSIGKDLSDKVYFLDLDFRARDFDSLSNYFQFIQDKLSNCKAYDVDFIFNQNIKAKECEIFVLFYKSGQIVSKESLIRCYDLILEYQVLDNRLQCVLEYNKGRLNENKVKKIIYAYNNLFDEILKN